MELEKHKTDKVLTITCFVIAIISAFFVCSQKGAFFVDELYSYGLANSSNGRYITDYYGGDIQGQILNKDIINEYLTVGTDEIWDYDEVYNNQIIDCHPPLFYWILHAVSSFFCGSFSKWYGLGINLLFYSATLMLVYRIARAIFDNMDCALTVCILYALSNSALSNVTLIRMYMVVTFLAMLLLYVFLRILKKEQKVRYFIFSGVIVFLGGITQYEFLIYAFILAFFLGVVMLHERKYKSFFGILAAFTVGIIAFLVVWPYLILQANAGSVARLGVTQQLFDINTYQRWMSFAYYSLRGIRIPVIIFVVLETFLLFAKSAECKGEQFIGMRYVVITCFWTYLGVSLFVPIITQRYVYFLEPLLIIPIGSIVRYYKNILAKKWIKILWYTVIIMVSLIDITIEEPMWICREDMQRDEAVEEIKGLPCVYIDNNFRDPLTSDLYQLSKYDDVLLLSNVDWNVIEQYINEHKNNKMMVVYIDSDAQWSSGLDPSATVKEILHQSGERFKKGQYMMSNTFTDVYLVY